MTTALPVAYYLSELSGEPPRRGAKELYARDAEASSNIEMQIAEAHARGILEARAAAQVENDAALAKQAAAFDRKLAAERERWSAEQGAALGQMITTALADIEQGISEQVGRILMPLLGEEARKRAVMLLAQSLGGMLGKGDYAKVTISGPQDLLSAVEDRLGTAHAGVTFVAAEGCDLSVVADTTILETRIRAWADAIEGDAP